MNTFLKSTIWILLFGLLSCEKEPNIKLYLDSIDPEKYYSEEIIPIEYQKIYGTWKLYEVSGGFSGSGYEPDFDYLEIKKIGIYGLIRNDSLFEYGKIELDTFNDNNEEGFLQVKFVPEFYVELNPYINPPEKYLHLRGKDSLDLISPCCDMYNYHFKRVR